MHAHHITVENIVVDVVKKDIKNLHLRVLAPQGRVRVTAPLRLNDTAIKSFVISKLSWIRKHQLKFERNGERESLEFVTGENHLYQGKLYPLNVIYHNGRPGVDLNGGSCINLYVRMGSNRLQREKVIIEWYRSRLKEQIPGLIEKWEHIIGVEVKTWAIRKMKTRWGSCMVNSGKICFNLELAKKPQICLEFIVVHELTHLLERSHNHIFKDLMDKFWPDWRHHQRLLNSQGGI